VKGEGRNNRAELYREHQGRFGPAVRRYAGKQKGLGSIPLRLSFLFEKVVACELCLVTLIVLHS